MENSISTIARISDQAQFGQKKLLDGSRGAQGVTTGSNLDFVDIDNDNDVDAFAGELHGTIKFYRNDGTVGNPFFVSENAVDVGIYSTPVFVDIDNDGDFDAFSGEGLGTVKFYRNEGNNINPDFKEQTGALNPLDGIDIGIRSAPAFVDINNDTFEDIFIGTKEGTVKYYKNDGSTFTEQTGSDNPFTGLAIDYNTPVFVDIAPLDAVSPYTKRETNCS